MTTAAYVRVSTVGQNESGQRRKLREWLKGNGVDNVRWYVDKGTGDNLDRPQFEKLQQDIFNGTVKTVVVFKLDRLSRDLADGIATLTDWLGKGVRVVSVTQQLDFSGATGKLVAAVLFAVAEMEQETRRERQAVGIAAAKERGVYKGGVKGRTKKGVKPARAKQLRKQGLTYAEIAEAMGISQSTARRYLGVI